MHQSQTVDERYCSEARIDGANLFRNNLEIDVTDTAAAIFLRQESPVAWFGSEEQKRKWIGEATSDPTAEYLAGWTVSEPAGTPGGTANFDSPGVGPVGIGLTATRDKGRGEYVRFLLYRRFQPLAGVRRVHVVMYVLKDLSVKTIL